MLAVKRLPYSYKLLAGQIIKQIVICGTDCYNWASFSYFDGNDYFKFGHVKTRRDFNLLSIVFMGSCLKTFKICLREIKGSS